MLRGLAKELAAGRGAHGGGAHRLRDPAEDARGDLRDARRARAPALRAPAGSAVLLLLRISFTPTPNDNI